MPNTVSISLIFMLMYLPVVILYIAVESHFFRPSVSAEQVTDSLLQGWRDES